MYEQPAIKKWAIFYTDMDRRTAMMFMETLNKCTESFAYDVKKPREFPIRTNRFEDWEKVIRENINSSVQAIVLILPGQKGKAPLYDDLKRLLIKEIPVPS